MVKHAWAIRSSAVFHVSCGLKVGRNTWRTTGADRARAPPLATVRGRFLRRQFCATGANPRKAEVPDAWQAQHFCSFAKHFSHRCVANLNGREVRSRLRGRRSAVYLPMRNIVSMLDCSPAGFAEFAALLGKRRLDAGGTEIENAEKGSCLLLCLSHAELRGDWALSNTWLRLAPGLRPAWLL